jgi:hypothetical protein
LRAGIRKAQKNCGLEGLTEEKEEEESERNMSLMEIRRQVYYTSRPTSYDIDCGWDHDVVVCVLLVKSIETNAAKQCCM